MLYSGPNSYTRREGPLCPYAQMSRVACGLQVLHYIRKSRNACTRPLYRSIPFVHISIHVSTTYIRSHTMLRTSKEARPPAAYPTDRSPSV